MNLLGVSSYFHDSAAALVSQGKILAAAQEERFTRVKGDARFPHHAVRYCLNASGLKGHELTALVYYEKPWLAFERILESSIENAPFGLVHFLASMPPWLGSKLNLRKNLRQSLVQALGPSASKVPILFSRHHLSHAASAFYASPFETSAVLCLDGVGEYATTSAWLGEGANLKPLWEIQYPHSLGLLYAAFTWYCGFKINSGEYKLMGLAPFGKPRFQDVIEQNLIKIDDDGAFRLNMKYFSFATDLKMLNRRFYDLFGAPPRPFEGPMPDIYLDVAASIQAVTEKVILKLCHTLQKETGQKNLCLAGGVALNCVANGRLLEKEIFEEIFVQPAAGDAGGALGAAWAAWHIHFRQPRGSTAKRDHMQAALLGPEFSEAEILAAIEKWGARALKLDDHQLVQRAAELLAEQKVIGWFQGRMEFGPRALGARSILGDPRHPEMKQAMNQKIKFREGFRPFAPIVLQERMVDQFSLRQESPYMLLVGQTLRPEGLPAITHVDGSARVQSVDRSDHPLLHSLLREFERLTGCPVLINTSFNVRGEPIVLNPLEALACLFNTDIDALAIGPFLVEKTNNSHIPKDHEWRSRFELD